MLSSVVYYALIIVAFFFDTFCFILCDKQIASTTLCFLVLTLTQPWHYVRIGFISLVVSCQCFFYYGWFGASLFYIIPAALLGSIIRGACYVTPLYNYGLLLMCLFIQYGVVEQSILGLPRAIPYTFSKVIVTLLVLALLSRKMIKPIEIIR